MHPFVFHLLVSESFAADFISYENEHSIILALLLMLTSDIHMKLVRKMYHVFLPDFDGGIKSVSTTYSFSINY